MTTPQVKFYKLKTGENLVAFELESTELFYRLRRPLSFTVENEPLSGRQMLDVREWIPPIVCNTDEITLPKEFVMLSTEVKDSFRAEFDEASQFLYNVEPRHRKKREDVPLMLKDPSTKPN